MLIKSQEPQFVYGQICLHSWWTTSVPRSVLHCARRCILKWTAVTNQLLLHSFVLFVVPIPTARWHRLSWRVCVIMVWISFYVDTLRSSLYRKSSAIAHFFFFILSAMKQSGSLMMISKSWCCYLRHGDRFDSNQSEWALIKVRSSLICIRILPSK